MDVAPFSSTALILLLLRATDAEPNFIVWLLLLSSLSLVLVIVWARIRWKRLKAELFPAPGLSEEEEDGALPAIRGSAELEPWLKDVPRLLGGVQRALEKEKSPEAQTLLEAARRLETAAPELPAAAQSVIMQALDTGELKSLLLSKQGLHAYVVAIPNRHEHSHLIRRYAPFSAGWGEHADLVRTSLAASGDFSALVGYLFFLSPDAKEGILLASYADPDTLLVPSSLFQGSQPKGGACKAVDASMEFKMSA
jgi:hypothetical protein